MDQKILTLPLSSIYATRPISPIIAIVISGIIDVEIFLNHPFEDLIKKLFLEASTQEMMKRISWSLLQIFPAFIFGFFSDRYQRRKTLVISQILGFFGGILLWIFNFKTWIFFYLGLTFNPLSIARATLLDNYPKISALKIISITYIAKNISWVIIDMFITFSAEKIINILLPFLLVSSIISWYFLKDKIKIKNELSNQNLLKRNRLPISLTIVALSLAETTFYILWIYLESGPEVVQQIHQKWLSIIAFGTLLGTSFAMFYRKIPHFAIITILYSAGSGIMLVTLFYSSQFNLSYDENLESAMSHYCIIGGIYLPFVTDALIELSGTRHKAIGSAFSEMSDIVALILASIFSIFLGLNAFYTLIVITILYGLATILQRCAEQTEDKKLL